MKQLTIFNNPHIPTSMNYRLFEAGIETIREGKNTFLEYKGKRISRPAHVNRTPDVVKREFGIEI